MIKSFEFAFPLMTQDNKPLGSILVSGTCYEENKTAFVETKKLDFIEGATLTGFTEWLGHNSTEQIDAAIQQHIEYVLHGDFSYEAIGAHTQIFVNHLH